MLKINKALWALFVIIFIIGIGCARKKHNPLKEIKNFKIYYGETNEQIVEDMKLLDLIILEPLQLTTSQVQEVRERGTKVIGYISVMEIGKWDKDIIEALLPEDLLYIQGKQIRVEQHDQDVGDIRSKHYQEILMQAIEQRIALKELDGIFLDTVDLVDFVAADVRTKKSLQKGYLYFLKKIKRKYPYLLLIQNRGFEVFNKGSNHYIEGLLWENFSSPLITSDEYTDVLINRLSAVEKRKNIRIFTVFYNNERENKEYIKGLGWVPLYHPRGSVYNDWGI